MNNDIPLFLGFLSWTHAKWLQITELSSFGNKQNSIQHPYQGLTFSYLPLLDGLQWSPLVWSSITICPGLFELIRFFTFFNRFWSLATWSIIILLIFTFCFLSILAFFFFQFSQTTFSLLFWPRLVSFSTEISCPCSSVRWRCAIHLDTSVLEDIVTMP